MSSSEFIRCKICGQDFETIDSLKEHEEAERKEQELRNKGFADG
jgi:transcription initiation factor IIE alpha subunit